MKKTEYEIFISNLRKHYGLDLFSYKQNQVQRRIGSYMVKKDYKSYQELFEVMRDNPNLVEEFIENITINVSNFFRNKAKWDILQREILPALIKKNPGKLKVWSAACSSGEEPYTLSIILSRLLPSHQYEIIATDLDLQILDKAKNEDLESEVEKTGMKGFDKLFVKFAFKTFLKNSAYTEEELERLIKETPFKNYRIRKEGISLYVYLYK